jgi:tetratricopeptide (TPR) repeat protein
MTPNLQNSAVHQNAIIDGLQKLGPAMKRGKTKIIFSIIIFGISLVTYLLTVAPTVSFWDCGEFIACANILGVPHPPGTPFFMLMGRTFILFFSFFEDIAFRMNLISVLGSSLGVVFTFLFTEKLLKLTLKEQKSTFITYIGGFVAAFLVNFSDTYWFNAVEAEVYGIAMFVVVLISWLSLVWVENRDTPFGERVLLLICYMAFLGIGFHLYTVMTFPAIIVMMYLLERDPSKSLTDSLIQFFINNFVIIITGTLLLSVVYMVGSFLTITAVVLGVWLLSSFLITDYNLKRKLHMGIWFCILAFAGYSTHAYIPIRSALNPRIDENNPEIPNVFDRESWGRYRGFVERKQYGSEGMLKRAMHRRGYLPNQILSHPHMGYGGYMLAQYLPWKVGEGRSSIVDEKYKGKAVFNSGENEPVKRLGMKFKTQSELIPPYTKREWQLLWFVLFHIPILWGGILAYKRNRPFGMYILLLYVLASAGLIFYMNFSDGIRPDLAPYNQWVSAGANPNQPPPNVHMEVRERDYFYAPGYMFMGILLGVSAAFLLVRIREKKREWEGVMRGTGVFLVVVAFILPCFSNYYEHDRSGIWVPYDYARNLLESCRPNSILFTNGDNDTFPLWFMQEVENVRMDVRVVNLSLANTDWYIHQLLEQEPKLILGFNHPQIDGLRPQPNNLTEAVEHKLGKTGLTVTLEGRDKKPYYKVQDIMVMNIVQNNYPERPVHFAVTVSNPNMMGLEKYLIMEGMAYTLTNELHNQKLEPERTAYLVDSVYWYRGLIGGKSYLNNDTRGLLSNYFATNHHLARWAQDKITVLDKEADGLKADTIWSDTLTAAEDSLRTQNKERLVEIAAEREEQIAYAENYINKTADLMPWDWRHYYFGSQFYRAIKQYPKSEEMLLKGLELEKREKAFHVQLAQLYAEQEKYDQAEELYLKMTEEDKEDFQVIYALSEMYDKQEKYSQAKQVLADWLSSNTDHQYAQFISRRIQDFDRKIQEKGPEVPFQTEEVKQAESLQTAPIEFAEDSSKSATFSPPDDSGE